jgi:choline dehydrogenase-like flavoprotein
MLEAGPLLDPERDFKQHVWPYELAHRGIGIGGREEEFLAPCSSWNIEGEPYSRTEGTRFAWLRTRAVGGRTNHWGQGAMRFSKADFKPYTTSGTGEDWPLSYEDIAPYYKKAEEYIGVFGVPAHDKESNGTLPLPSPGLRCTERLVKTGCEALDIPCEPFTMAVLTRSHNGRAACHYCGQCYRGCKTSSCFSSSQVLLPPALATGKLTLCTNAMARAVLLSSDGKASGVSYIDKATASEQEARARIVVLAASACESARLLLNSKTSIFPDGLANSSGVIGRYLMESVGSGGEGYFPDLEKVPPHNHDGTGGTHVYIPRSPALESDDFSGGYHIEFGGGPRMPSVAEFDDLCRRFQSYGLPLKQECRRRYGKYIYFLCLGETTASEHNYCEPDPAKPDKWGIPTLKFHFRRNENDLKMARHMQKKMKEIVGAAGGNYLTSVSATGDDAHGITTPGETFHELGTVRMGNNPRTSALNRFCQAHDVKNLFVVDGGCFVSLPDKTPTLTILALAWRASEYIVAQGCKGNV